MKKFLIVFIVLIASCSSSSDDSSSGGGNEATLPTVTLNQVTQITTNSAVSGGNVTSDGNATVTARGVCWSTSQNPTINDSKTTNGSGTGTYTSQLIGLEGNTQYFVRAYATNSEGTSYSSQQNFQTLEELNCSGVYEGDVDISSQTELDAFGENNYEIITGDLFLGDIGTDPIVDLTPLSCLTRIDGRLQIYSSQLTNLEGLNNITSVAQLLLWGCANLISIDGLIGLQEITTSGIYMNNLPVLTNLDGLENLTNVNGSVLLVDSAFENLNGLINASGFTGLLIDNCDNLENLVGLNGFYNLGGIYIESCNNLKNLNGLNNVVSLNEIVLDVNPQLEDISALTAITGIVDRIEISFCPVTSLSGLDNIERVNDLIEISETEISNLNGLNSLESVGGLIEIDLNDSLLSLDGLNNLINVNNISIHLNNSLADLCALQNLLINGDITGNYNVGSNAYNPTQQDIIDGNCSQ